MLRSTLPLAWILYALCGCAELSESVTRPQRPTVSSDTNTTRAGHLELEAGGDVDPGDFFTTPVTLKAGYNENREIYASWNAYQKYEESPGPNPQLDMMGNVDEAEGIGDIVIGLRERFWTKPETGTSVAFQGEVKLPTAEDDIGTGEVDAFAALIGTRAWDRIAVTGFYRFGILGDPDENGMNFEHAFALAGSGAITGPLGAYGEIAAIVAEEQDRDDVFTTAGLQWALTPEVVLDLGAAVGLSKDAPALRIVGGLTWNLGKFF